jgi:hypothetical protein
VELTRFDDYIQLLSSTVLSEYRCLSLILNNYESVSNLKSLKLLSDTYDMMMSGSCGGGGGGGGSSSIN